MASMLIRCAVLAAFAASTSALAPSSEAATASPYGSARQCAECHKSIHSYWSESEHARSATSKAFLAGLDAILQPAPDKDKARRNCVWCHAPTALASGDYALEEPITREGVTCDFCHTVKDVELSRPGHPFDLQPGDVKRGPLEFAKSSFHATAYSALHKTSPLLCASCHEHKNALGVAVLSTYSEWREGPYAARGETCQECHMPLVPGETVQEGGHSTQRRINLHRPQGGSVASRLRSGLELKIEALDIGAASADVQLSVSNTRVGHAAPGGLPTKSLVLAVGVDAGSGELMHRREHVYGLELKDAEGRAVVSAADAFQKAAAVGKDTRLRQKESRRERFTVPLSQGWKAIVARLEYRDASDPAGPPKTILVAEERRERGR